MFDKNVLLSLEQRLVSCVDDAGEMSKITQEIKETYISIERRVAQGAFSSEELCVFDEQAARIKLIARQLLSLEKSSRSIIQSAKEEAQRILISDPSPIVSAPSLRNLDTIETSKMQETLNSKILRRWFLDHVADPFPSRRTKEDLVLTTNALLLSTPPSSKKARSSLSKQPIDYSQCTLWFINSRRRSHWTDFFRQFAHSDKERMRRLVECLQREEDAVSPGQNEELEILLECNKPDDEGCCQDNMDDRVKDCREMYTNIMDWIRQVVKEEVGDWMDEVIREAKLEVKREKKAMKVEKKRLADMYDNKEDGREQQRRKISKDQQNHARTRRSDRNQRRKIGERKERRDQEQLQSSFHTPQRCELTTRPEDSSAGSSNWTSFDSSLRVPSSTSSNSTHIHPSSSSSITASSVSSFEAFPRIPCSPSLNIRSHKPLDKSQQNLKPIPSEAQVPMNPALLYTSNVGLAAVLKASSSPSLSIQLPLTVDGHLEEELSGGSRSHGTSLNRSNPPLGMIKLEKLSPSTSNISLDQLPAATNASNGWYSSTYRSKRSPS